MKKKLQKLFAMALVLFTINATAQNEVYWREGFEPDGNPPCDLTTTSPSAAVSYYFNGNAGKWYGSNVYRTTGSGCGGANNHVRYKNISGVTDSGFLVTPIVDFGIKEFHFYRGRSSRITSFYVTSDTNAKTTSWIYVTSSPKSAGTTTCTDTTIMINSATARRLKIVCAPGTDTDLDSMWITSVNHILPVKFGAFSATVNSGLTKLNWQIETEINTGSYVIERSSNSKEFTAVGTIEAKQLKSYSWIDASASNAVNYYRIKAIDKDGKFMYSSVLKVSNEKTAKAELTIAPNPVVNSSLNVQLNGINKGSYNVNIYSIAGALVYKSNIVSEGLNCNKTIALPASIKGGNYILEIVGDNTHLTKSILVN